MELQEFGFEHEENGRIYGGGKTKLNRSEADLRNLKVELTDRDLKILEFILDMKFARVKDVFEKFFKNTLSGDPARSEAWAKKRLFQLKEANYLTAHYSYFDNERFFIARAKSYRALTSVYPERNITKAVRGIDHRTLTHDRAVLEFRIRCELENEISDWISDRKLKNDLAKDFGLTSTNVPDGIYKNASGERVAFELEISQKAKSRYRSRVEHYVNLIRERRGEPNMFSQVKFICLNKAVYKILKEEASVYDQIISVELAQAESSVMGAAI